MALRFCQICSPISHTHFLADIFQKNVFLKIRCKIRNRKCTKAANQKTWIRLEKHDVEEWFGTTTAILSILLTQPRVLLSFIELSRKLSEMSYSVNRPSDREKKKKKRHEHVSQNIE